jgi:hypothetical protein
VLRLRLWMWMWMRTLTPKPRNPFCRLSTTSTRSWIVFHWFVPAERCS